MAELELVVASCFELPRPRSWETVARYEKRLRSGWGGWDEQEDRMRR